MGALAFLAPLPARLFLGYILIKLVLDDLVDDAIRAQLLTLLILFFLVVSCCGSVYVWTIVDVVLFLPMATALLSGIVVCGLGCVYLVLEWLLRM